MAHVAEAHAGHGHDAHDHAPQAFIWKYVFSKDHKVIGVQYYVTAMLMAVIAGLLAMLIRLQIAWPTEPMKVIGSVLTKGYSNGIMDPAFYAMLFTMHGTI